MPYVRTRAWVPTTAHTRLLISYFIQEGGVSVSLQLIGGWPTDDACIKVRCCEVEVCVAGATIIRDVTFGCCRGEWVVLSGPNGAGKASLLRTINGLCPPSAGRVWAFGSWIPGRSRRDGQRRARQRTVFDAQTAAADVQIALRAGGLSRSAAQGRARAWLDRLGLQDRRVEYPHLLSGGERQRVAFARALAPRSQLLVLDEPTAHLNDGAARIVLAAIKELVENGATVVVSSHRGAEPKQHERCRITLEAGQMTTVCA